LTYFDGSSWVDYEAGYPQGAISATTGSPGTGTFTDGEGLEWDYYRWTSNGSLTISQDGYVDVLVVGGGAASINYTAGNPGNRKAGGGAGVVRYGLQYLTAGTYTVTVGSGGVGTVSTGLTSPGSQSSIGSAVIAGGGSSAFGFVDTGNTAFDGGPGSGGGIAIKESGDATSEGGGALGTPNNYDGIELNYAGSAVTYGVGGHSATPVANTGSGGDYDVSGDGTDGVVIVRVLS